MRRYTLYKIRTNNNSTMIVKARPEDLEKLYQDNRIKEYGLLKVYRLEELAA